MFTCNTCEKGFSRKNDLTRHNISVHTPIKKHKCEVCNKAFSRLDAMKNHRKIHDKANKSLKVDSVTLQQNESIEQPADENVPSDGSEEEECEDDCVTETSINSSLLKKSFPLTGGASQDLLLALKTYKV